jgi:2-C-methyl-D-erythritol 2,4-cyclodiphosphate synthase
LRVGHGFDVHALAEGRKLILAGVVIDHPLGLAGHSDADVMTHAVIDALLGAAGLGDIGMHFPDSDPAYRDASSMKLLGIITQAVGSLGYTIENVDVTLMAQEPKIGLHRPSMVENLAAAMAIEPDRVNVKATTTEGLGFVGRVEGIAASAVALLKHSDDR